jgi:hypothetical protein
MSIKRRNRMLKFSKVWLIAIVLAMALCLIAGSVSAADTTTKVANTAAPHGNGPSMDKMLQNLTQKGYDVANVQAAVKSGDNETARKLLDDFYTKHPEAKPQRPQMTADGIKKILSNLTASGNDVTSIQKALDGGNVTLAQNLLEDFWKAHPDSMPKGPANGQKPTK